MDAELEEYDACVEYYCKIMTRDDVLLLKDLVRKIPRAPSKARHYLQRHCRNVREMEEFFRDQEHFFFVENGRVALYDEELETAPERAQEYFREVLEEYEDPVHVSVLKQQHLGNASDLVAHFITRFYPCKEFKRFFKSRPDVFVLDKEHKVFLIEVEAVAFFEKRLELFGRENLHFMHFRGHVAQASQEIQKYIHKKYFADDFQIFLKRNSDVFVLDENGYVSLVPLA